MVGDGMFDNILNVDTYIDAAGVTALGFAFGEHTV